jgi:hypothetical protein
MIIVAGLSVILITNSNSSIDIGSHGVGVLLLCCALLPLFFAGRLAWERYRFDRGSPPHHRSVLLSW